MDASQQEVRVALGMMIERARVQGVKAWCLVTIDDKYGKIVCVEGTFEDEVSAIAEAQRQKNESAKFIDDADEPGWTYLVVPYYATERTQMDLLERKGLQGVAIPKNLTVTRRGDDLGRHEGRWKTLGEHPGAFIRELDSRSPVWVGSRYCLYIPVEGERDSDGEQRYEQVEMEGCVVSVNDDSISVEGFVHVNPETGEPVRFVQDDHTGLYRREWWTQRGRR